MERMVLKSIGFFVGLIWVGSFQSCNEKESDKTLFVRLDPEETGIDFFNEVKDQDYFNVFSYRNFYNGGGVAIGDVNNDGLADLYFTANMTQNKLYLNKGNWKFEDITETAGVGGAKSWSTGVTMADVNGDGWLDIYVCNSGDLVGDNKQNELFINNGDLTFTESAAKFGLDKKGYSTHASFFDYDLDGDLDCYLLNNSYKSIDKFEQFLSQREDRDVEGGDKLLRNDGNTFTDVSIDARIYGGWIGFGLGVSVSDLNDDMLPDIFISNDFWERDYLYINKGDGTFSEELIQRTDVISGSSMGSDVADLDNNGSAEIFTTEMLPGDNHRLKTMTRFEETNIKELKVRSSYHYQLMQNCLHVNEGDGHFREMAFLSGVAATDWSWGALIFDMDNNGWKDIFVSNGIFRDITSMDFADFVADKENIKNTVLDNGKFDFNNLLDQIPSTPIANYAFINQENMLFQDLADSLGLGEPSFSNGAAYGDLDNDGDLDLVVNNLNMPAFIYRNESQKHFANNFLKIAFKGPDGNPNGIGAKVMLFSAESHQSHQNFTSRGFQSSTEPKMVFGLGKTQRLDSLVVVWPNLKKQVIRDIKANQELVLDHSKATADFMRGRSEHQPIFKEISDEMLKGNYVHRENDFNDFDHERLLPRKISTEGPKIIKGDLNNDTREDFMLLGAFGDPDKIFFQTSGGTFEEQDQKDLKLDQNFESTCGAFFDADGDGDLDVLVGSGGNQFNKGVEVHFLRYYENDGSGNLIRSDKAPKVAGNFSCIVAEDFDGDGDQDVFVGGRVVPGNYGLTPRSYLFRNDGSHWENIAPASLSGVGMVTDAEWSDINNDGNKDLIVVGEWMPVTIFKNEGASLSEGEAIPHTSGWWTSIEKADLDADGDEDFVMGNWGLNTKFKASAEKPISMFVKDFDNNGKSEFIINWYPPLDEMAYPFAGKMDLTQQMPSLRKSNLKYGEYAGKTYETLIAEQQRAEALAYKVEILESSILWNEKKLRIEELPLPAQVSPVFAIAVEDFDEDGIRDIWLGGNFWGLKPEVGRHNSSKGIFLKGSGSGKYQYASPKAVGMYVEGEVRDAVSVYVDGKIVLMVGRNDNSILCFRKNSYPGSTTALYSQSR